MTPGGQHNQTQSMMTPSRNLTASSPAKRHLDAPGVRQYNTDLQSLVMTPHQHQVEDYEMLENSEDVIANNEGANSRNVAGARM